MSQGPLRILLTDSHSDGGGQVRYLQSLASSLVRQGHAVTAGCRKGSVIAPIARASGGEALDQFHFARGLRPASWWRDIRVMRAYLRASRPHVVHVNGSQDHWVSALAQAAHGFNIPLVRTRHNTYSVKRGLANRILNRHWTTHQITVCEMVRETLADHPAFDPARLTTIHNGVDTAVYRPDADARARARAEFGYAPGDFVCGIAARLVAAKGHTYLFEAAADLVERLPHLRILVLGQGVLEEPLKAQVEQLGLADRVHFAGFRDDMPACVQALDLGVLPSIDCDTSSFSLKEQMAAGIPVVASDYGGLPEILQDGVEGFVVPHGTVGPLVRAIARLADDAALREAMGQAGRARVLREFSLEAFAGRTVAVYRRVLAGARVQQLDGPREHTAP